MTTSARMWLISAGSRETAPTQQAATTARAFPGTRRRDGPSSRPTMAPNVSVTSGSLRPLCHCSDLLNSRFCAFLLPCWRWNFFYACPPGWAAPSSPPDISVLRQNSRIVAKTKKKKRKYETREVCWFLKLIYEYIMYISCTVESQPLFQKELYRIWNEMRMTKPLAWNGLAALFHSFAGTHTITTTMCAQGRLISSL